MFYVFKTTIHLSIRYTPISYKSKVFVSASWMLTENNLHESRVSDSILKVKIRKWHILILFHEGIFSKYLNGPEKAVYFRHCQRAVYRSVLVEQSTVQRHKSLQTHRPKPLRISQSLVPSSDVTGSAYIWSMPFLFLQSSRMRWLFWKAWRLGVLAS